MTPPETVLISRTALAWLLDAADGIPMDVWQDVTAALRDESRPTYPSTRQIADLLMAAVQTCGEEGIGARHYSWKGDDDTDAAVTEWALHHIDPDRATELRAEGW